MTIVATSSIFSLAAAALAIVCPFGYTEYAMTKCVRYYTEDATFDGANERCQSDGGDLISIHSQAENDAIFGGMDGQNASWIGLKCNPSARTFAWVDKSPVDYFGFSDTTCNSADNGFVMRANTGMWSYGERQTYHYICGIDMGSADSRCDHGYTFEEETSNCLKVVEAPNTWTNAEAGCQNEDAHLVSIHDQQTNAFVRRIATEHRLFDGIFIGMRLNNSGPSWADGSPFDYQNFDLGMPNDMFGNCAEMLTKVLDGQWASVHCDSLTRLPYVCAKPASVVESSCPSQNTYTNSGEILSPGYPSSNTADLSCEYFIAAPKGSHVLLQFSEYTLTEGDSITIYEGEADDNVIALLNSTSLNTAQVYRTDTDNVMKLMYNTGDGNGARVWHIQYMSIF